MRQPNHLATLSLWALVALAWLVERRRVGGAAGLLFGLALVMAVVLSFSRTGTVGIVLLGLWGLVALGWSARVRVGLALLPLLYAAGWWLATHLASHGEDAAARFTTHGDISSSRFAIWSDTLALIRARPWTGVGWGEFNFAWSLTPSPHRPVAFFDHTHNLPLQFAVELGLPLALLVLGLLGWALWRLVVTAVRAAGRGPHAPEAQALALLVLLMALHSQLEYPLWYAYFLLPTAFAWGLGLGAWAGRAGAGAAAAPGMAGEAAAGHHRLRGRDGRRQPAGRRRLLARGGDLRAAARRGVAGRAHPGRPAQPAVRPPCALCGGHLGAAARRGDDVLPRGQPLPARHAPDDGLGARLACRRR
ncbi:Wzy polymerase domain-containing protein [Piscinibacter sakaiensis]|uniref:O-antigen ligase family protein n=1 Tax=Piscinibacter sakaiensis TaxID=1547922 RepID=UPI00372B1DEB